MFLKFHIKLVLTNSTTIESLDTEHQKDYEKFDIGYLQNWEQVFGCDVLFWFIPFPTKRGRPEGDGLTWKTRENTNLGNSNRQYASSNYDTNYFSNINSSFHLFKLKTSYKGGMCLIFLRQHYLVQVDGYILSIRFFLFSGGSTP